MNRSFFRLWIAVFLSLSIFSASAQNELAATLEVLTSGVDVLRVNTANWIRVEIEAIVGVGDQIRTDTTGRARITFFADGVDTELLPNTQYRIGRFEGSEDSFTIEAEVIIGQTTQRLNRLLDANSKYEIDTPGMSMGARGTAFAIRVEADGRSAMLVSDGNVAAANDSSSADVPPGFGIRALVDQSLSEVVHATTFAELDAALDGCSASLTAPDDVSLNVRLGPARDFDKVGTIEPAQITVLFGTVESGGWYRIAFRGGFGWILSSTADISEDCAGLRIFPSDHGPEDITLLEVEQPAPPVESTPEVSGND